MSEENEPDVTEKIVETEVGYRLVIESKRGNGTDDRDTVKVEHKTEERPSSEEQMNVVSDVTSAMNVLRHNQPDGENEDDS